MDPSFSLSLLIRDFSIDGTTFTEQDQLFFCESFDESSELSFSDSDTSEKPTLRDLLTSEPLALMADKATTLCDRILSHVAATKGSSLTKVKRTPDPGSITFWIKRDIATGQTKIQLNIPKYFIGQGNYKRVKGGLEFDLFDFRSFRYVRLKPSELKWDQSALDGFKTHKLLYDRVNDPKNGVSIAYPPYLRKESEQNPGEYIQPFYPYCLQSLVDDKVGFSFLQRLKTIHGIFCTLEAIHSQGYVFRDLKYTNVLLDRNFTHYVNDFDLTTNVLLAGQARYAFWDKASQAGFVTPYCDMVGGALVMLYTVAPDGFVAEKLQFNEDHSYFDFRSVQRFMAAFHLQESPHKESLEKIIALAIRIIEGENTIYNAIRASMRCFFNDDKKRVLEWTFDRFKAASISNAVGVTFAEYLVAQGFTLDLPTTRSVIKILISTDLELVNVPNTKLKNAVLGFIGLLHEPDQNALKGLAYDYKHLSTAIKEAKKNRIKRPRNATEKLFKNLLSQNEASRLKAFKALERIAPSTKTVKEVFHSLITSASR